MPDTTDPWVAAAGAGAAARTGLVRRLADASPRLAEVASRAAAMEPARREPAGGWTVREVVAHLWLVEGAVFQRRLDQLAAGESPVWEFAEPGTSDAPEVAGLDAALAAFAARRAGTLARVEALDEAGWQRFGHHATYGRLDVEGLLGVIANHDAEHIADLEARTR